MKNIFSSSKIILFSFFICIIVGYAIFQSHRLISGPHIDVWSPQNGAVFASPLVEIDGQASNISYIRLDGRKIFTDTQGRFREQLLLSPGYNILTLDAQDKFGRSVSRQLELILKEY